MGAGFEDKQRQVIPRWRTFRETVAFGETARSEVGQPMPVSELHELLEAKLAAWSKSRDVVHAADLIATAVVSGELPAASEALEFVLRSGSRAPQGLRDLAVQMTAAPAQSPSEFHETVAGVREIGIAIRRIRAALIDYPRNPVVWVDLARLRTLQGSGEAAERAMSVALSLAPDNRFVLRSAARLQVHLGDLGRAHDLLRNHPRTVADPWLLAAEIAVAHAAHRRSRLVAKGSALVEGKKFRPFSIAELAGAIGTEEAQSGNRKQARKLFRIALEEPTENVVAQAVWVARHTNTIEVKEDALATPHSHEAHAWTLFGARDWERALTESKRWFADQPFSSRPAIMATYIASTPLGRHRDAVEIAQVALRANPQDTVLLNNLAFSLASMEDVTEATRVFGRITDAGADVRTRVMLTATRGLLAFRSGELAMGRELYKEAIDLAREHDSVKQEALGTAYLAREEIRARSRDADTAVNLAWELAERSDCEEARLVLRAIDANKAAGTGPSPNSR